MDIQTTPYRNPNEGRVIAFTNITDEDFTHPYGGQPFFVKARETVMFPWSLANHLATHLARKVLLKTDKSSKQYDPKDETGGVGKPIWDDQAENELKSKILGASYQQEVATPKSEIELLKEQVDQVLGTLSDRERRVLEERFGLKDGRPKTLEEVGKMFAVTRERIRQIEAKSLRKLRHPSRGNKLKDYLG